MALIFRVFGVEIASLTLDIPEGMPDPLERRVDKGIKAVSRWWVSRGMK